MIGFVMLIWLKKHPHSALTTLKSMFTLKIEHCLEIYSMKNMTIGMMAILIDLQSSNNLAIHLEDTHIDI